MCSLHIAMAKISLLGILLLGILLACLIGKSYDFVIYGVFQGIF
jgi:hypothetical protein